MKNVTNNSELLPSSDKDRTLKTGDLIILCAGMVINVVGLVIPSQIYLGGGLTPLQVLFSACFGFAMVSVLIILTGDIGTKYGVPFTVYVRACLGRKGAIIGSLFRAIVCMTWVGVIMFFGTSAIDAIIQTWLGISQFWLIFIIFACAQLYNASRGVKSMSRFGWLAIPLLGITLVSMVAWLLSKYNISLPEVLAKPAIAKDANFTFIGSIAVFAGGWLSEALNGSDLSRKLIIAKDAKNKSFFVRNKSMMIAFTSGFIVTGVILSGAGLISGVLTSKDNPVDIIKVAFNHQPVILLISCLILVMAQWSTNTVANIFPATLILLNIFPKLSFKLATWIIGFISCAAMPWLLAKHLDYVQIIFSAALAPLLAIILVHYYIIRKCQLNVENIYADDYMDWNKNGLVALLVGLVSGAILHQQAFFVAFPVSAIVYYLLCKTNVLNQDK